MGLGGCLGRLQLPAPPGQAGRKRWCAGGVLLRPQPRSGYLLSAEFASTQALPDSV